jgi:MYXO-CTERM domain-containing protein
MTGRTARLAPGALVLVLAASCGVGEDPQYFDDADLRGELVTYMVDFPDQDRADVRYALRQANGEERSLHFQTPPQLTAGAELKVWGVPEGDAFRVLHFEAEEATQSTSALIGAPKRALRRWAFVIVNTGGVPTLTKEAAQQKLFSLNPGSIRSYYREVSYGLQDLDGEVFGPIDYQMTGTCDTDLLARNLKPMVAGTFNQYLWYFNSRVTGCGFAGLASLGNAERPSSNSWYNASSGCVVLVQEPGHNFGMVHSSSMRCTKAGAPVTIALPDDPDASCTHSEYGNPYDPMGNGCYHMNGYQKAYQDWLAGCNVLKVTTSGTFSLLPLEKACNGIQLLQIPFPAPRVMSLRTGGSPTTASISSYFLEFRGQAGIDAPLSKRVLVTVGGDIREAQRSGGRNWLVDMTPETPNTGDVALPLGVLYSDPDPNGPRFALVAMDAEKATIRVELGPNATADQPGTGVCDDGTTLTAPGPETCDAVPAPGGNQPPPDDTTDGGRPDGATTYKPPTKPTGCGCHLDPGSNGGWAVSALVLLALLRRRRSR